MAVIFFRTLIIFALLLLLMRILGKRQMGELEISELIVSVLVADIAAVPLQDASIPLINGIVPMVVLFCCEIITSEAALKSIRLRCLLCGKPCILILDGKICQPAMRKCRFSVDELAEELRSKDITDISRVKFAVLETDGSLNAVLQPGDRPVTASQLGISASDEGYAVVVIEEGKLLDENLSITGHDRNWLDDQLRRRGADGPDEVYAMIVFGSGKIYFQKMEKR